jgi:hypothetical protein
LLPSAVPTSTHHHLLDLIPPRLPVFFPDAFLFLPRSSRTGMRAKSVLGNPFGGSLYSETTAFPGIFADHPNQTHRFAQACAAPFSLLLSRLPAYTLTLSPIFVVLLQIRLQVSVLGFSLVVRYLTSFRKRVEVGVVYLHCHVVLRICRFFFFCRYRCMFPY